MRYYEIASGMRVPLSGEEQTLLSRVEEEGHIVGNSLDERQAELARQMVTRGLLVRMRVDGDICFGPNADHNLRRF